MWRPFSFQVAGIGAQINTFMKIRFKTTFGAHYAGKVTDVSPQIAGNLVRIGVAEKVADAPEPEPVATTTKDYTTGKRAKAVSK